jgi:hypothetical protein
MARSVKQNIIATLTYYAVLEYPLTTFEVWKYYMDYLSHDDEPHKKVTLQEITTKLHELFREDRITEACGMWCLPGTEHLRAQRMYREKISAAKLRRMRSLVAVLRYVPFVRMVFATGSLALRNGSKKSDWDMFIVLQNHRLFTGRTLLTLVTQLLGKRRHGNKITDRACLNYYCTEAGLKVEPADWYAAYEYQSMVPFVLPRADTFFRANSWISTFRPNASLPVAKHRLTLPQIGRYQRLQMRLEQCLEFLFGSRTEQWLAAWQRRKIQKNPKTALPGSLIVASDERLVFFPRPKGPRVYQAFYERLTF